MVSKSRNGDEVGDHVAAENSVCLESHQSNCFLNFDHTENRPRMCVCEYCNDRSGRRGLHC